MGPLAKQVHDQLALVRPVPVFPEIDSLPGTEHGPALGDRNRKLSLRQRRADMGWHVVRPLVLVPVSTVATIGHEASEKRFEVNLDVR